MIDFLKKCEWAIDERSDSFWKKNEEYSTHSYTKLKWDHWNILSSDAHHLKQAHEWDQNAHFYVLSNLKKINEWKKTSKKDRKHLKKETVKNLLTKCYCLNQSNMFNDFMIMLLSMIMLLF